MFDSPTPFSKSPKYEDDFESDFQQHFQAKSDQPKPTAPQNYPKQAKPINFKLALIPLVVAGLLVFGGFSLYNSNKPDSNAKATVLGVKTEVSASSSSQKIEKPANLQLKMLFFGNTFWGRFIDDWAKASELKEKYPFSGLNTLEKEKYDAWVSGLECPVTDTYRSSELQDGDLKFNCMPEYLPEAAKWFEAFTLANNHTDNMEEVDGFAKTQKNLTDNGIQYFGHFDSDREDDLCQVISFPIKKSTTQSSSSEPDKIAETEEASSSISNKSTESDAVESSGQSQTTQAQSSESIEKVENELASNQSASSESISLINPETNEPYFIPVAMCGYHNVFKLPTEQQLAKISQYAKFLPTIVMPHGGAEYAPKADSLKTSLYRQMVELGADAVIGDHPHVVQNTEVWKDKLIVYSLGNFMFDQQNTQNLRQSLAMDLEMDLKLDQNLENWLKFSKECQKAQDNCLQMAEEQNLEKPEFSFNWQALATDSTGKLTKKAGEAVTNNVLARANWESTQKALAEVN